MNDILDWGITVVLWFQQFSPALDIPFKILTFFGNEEFFLIFFPLFYWCFDKKNGIRLTLFFLISAYVNFIGKAIFAQPRPFQYSTEVKGIVSASGGGLPSGHTQGSVVLWGFLMSKYKSTWLVILGCAMIVLVPLSRIYLGVHFPTDLLAGYLIGALLLFLYFRLEPRIEQWFAGMSFMKRLAIASVLPLIFLLFSNGVKDIVSAASAMLGLCLGFVAEHEWVAMDASGDLWKKILRFLIGVLMLAGIFFGLKVAFQALAPEMSSGECAILCSAPGAASVRRGCL